MIETKDLAKDDPGGVRALDGLSFEVALMPGWMGAVADDDPGAYQRSV
jgi:hypothetical protein